MSIEDQSTNHPKVFIIILNYNGRNHLRTCLSSVFRINYPNFEVVLVDNNSGDGSLEEARLRFPRCHFIKNEENIGFSSGNNIGIKFALERMADYVLLLNDDTEVSRDLLLKLVGAGESDEKVGILSPLVEGNQGMWFVGGEIDWLRMKTNHLTSYSLENKYIHSDFISGCSMLVKKKVFKTVGLLDEDFFLYWEDVDFSVRAKRAGFSLRIVPDAKIFHAEKSEKMKEEKTYWLVLSGLLFFQKNSPRLLRPWIWLFVKIRMLKNKLDMKRGSNPVALSVSRAYNDFQRHARSS